MSSVMALRALAVCSAMVCMSAGGLHTTKAAIHFTTEQDFHDEIGPLSLAIESFEDLPFGDVAAPISLAGFSLAVPNDTRATVTGLPFASDGLKSVGFPYRGPPTAVVTFPQPVHAVAFDIIDILDTTGGGAFQYSIDGSPFVDVYVGSLPGVTAHFVGIVDAVTPFSQLAFQTTDAGDAIYIDRVQYESPTQRTIPEPMGEVVWVTLGGIALAVRRRR